MTSEHNYDKESGFDIILKGLADNLFLTDNKPTTRYARKFLKLLTIGITLIFLSGLIFYIVIDVGYNSSTFLTHEKSGIIEMLDEMQKESELLEGGTDDYFEKEVYSEAEGDSVVTVTVKEYYSIGKIMRFFVERQNSIIIYIGMIILLIAFNVMTYKRLWYMWRSYVSQYNLNESVIYVDKTHLFQGIQWFKSQEVKYDDICSRFLKRIFTQKNRELFSEHYRDFKTIEEERAILFEENVNKNAVWIIRLGIFGTLLGVAIAFFELYVAMGTFEIGETISEDFLKQVQQALLGNAIAVATSLTAHGATLLIEIGVTFFLKNDNNLKWLNDTYDKLLQFDGFSSSVETTEEKVTALNMTLTGIISNLDNFSQGVGKSLPNVDGIGTTFIEMNNSMDQTSTKLQLLTTSIGKYEDQFVDAFKKFEGFQTNISSITDSAQKLSSSITNLENSVKTISEETNRFQKFVRGLISSQLNMMKDSANSLQKSFNSISKNIDKK